MSSEVQLAVLWHVFCVSQWIAFAMVHWAYLGKGRLKHLAVWMAGCIAVMLMLSVRVEFGYFNPMSIAANVCYLLMTSLLFGGTWRMKLLSCLINGVMCLLTENAITYLYALFSGLPVQEALQQPGGVLTLSVGILVVGVLTARVTRSWTQKQVLEPLQMLVAMFFPGVVVVLNMVLMVSGGNLDPIRFGALITAGLTAAVLAHLFFVQLLNEQVVQRKDSQYRAALEQERAEALMESYTTQRRLTHEFTNHIDALDLMLQQGDVEGAKRYLREVGKTIQTHTSIMDTHNPLLDALLSKKYEEAARRGVMMYFDLSDLREIPLDPTDLVIVVSNLLNNAIEAAAQAQPPEVHVRFRRMDQELVFSVRNRVQKDFVLPPEGQLPRSTKGEPGHGMGLVNVKDVLDRCGAEYTFSCREGWFRFTCAVSISKL